MWFLLLYFMNLIYIFYVIMNLIKTNILFLLFFTLCISYDCTDNLACNYNPDAIIDDGSCYRPVYDCDCDDLNNDGICDNQEDEDCYNIYCPPSGFGFKPQLFHLSIGIDEAFKFNSETTLDIEEDWIGAFKDYNETIDSNGNQCISISENCPDVNYDGQLTSNAEVCVGSYVWKGNNGNTRIPLYGNDGDPNWYLNNGEQPYFKLFDSDTDEIYFMLAYKDGLQYQITCGEDDIGCNISFELFELDLLEAECPFYNNLDQDNDNIPDTCDQCPNDFENDADNDDICGNNDECPYDANMILIMIIFVIAH